MKINRNSILVKTLWLSSSLLTAGSAQAINVQVGDLTDNRTTGQFFGGLEFELKIIGDISDPSAQVKVNIASAVDGTGKNLLGEKAEEAEFSKLRSFGDSITNPKIKLLNPARSAEMIKEIKGELLVYSPSKDPAALVKIAKVLSLGGKALENPTLKANKIEMTVSTPAQTAAAGKAAREKQALQAEKEGASAEMVAQIRQGFGFGGGDTDSKRELTFNIADPQNRIVAYRLLDAAGKEIDQNGSMTSAGSKTVYFSQDVPDNATLEVQLMTDKATERVPLALSNIALP